MSKTIRAGQATLFLLSLSLYVAEILVLQHCALPYTLLACFGILMFDLFFCSPIKAGVATLCLYSVTHSPNTPHFLYLSFSSHLFRKAVTLRVIIWQKRLFRYMVFLSPSAWLFAASECIFETHSQVYNMRVIALIVCIAAWALLILGILCIETRLLRYKAAWYLLILCKRVSEAIQASKTLSMYHLEDIVFHTVTHPPTIVDRLFAEWIIHQIRISRHAYNFSENTNTVMG